MATEFNYVARLDTTQIMSGLAEIRSQVGMALGSATGFASPAMAMAQGGGAAASGIQQMFAGGGWGGGGLGGSGFGGTHTNPAMAYSPHYGAVQAQTSLEQEWAVHRFGVNAAMGMKPPGVGAGQYAMAVESNFINRQMEASHGAAMAAQGSFFAGAGNMAAGELASMAVAPIGAMAGGAVAGRLLGAGAVGAGRLLGGLAAGFYAFDKVGSYVGGQIEEHFADVTMKQGVTRELGELAGAGRGLNRSQRTELGIAAYKAAGDLGMDVQQMGDILAIGRQGGMLPSATDPAKAREQFREFAKTIEEGAQVIQTSLAGAAQVIRTAAQSGMSAQEGIVRAAGAGGADIWLAQQARMSAFGGQGADVGRSMGFSGAQGSAMFIGSLGAGAGLSREEMTIAGGRFGAAAFVGQTSMAMASSGLGDAQLMAAMGGAGTGGMGFGDLAGAAMAGLGDDMLTGMGRFMVHKNEYRRGIGASGIRTMARQQIEMGGEMIAGLMPGLSENEAERLYAQSMGLNPDQAKLLVGGVGRGGGGGRGKMTGEQEMNALQAMQGARLTGSFQAPELETGAPGFGLGYATEGAMAGMALGPKGALAGAAIGLVAGNIKAIGGLFDTGPGLFASSDEKKDFYERKMSAEYESRMTSAKQRLGMIDFDAGIGSRARSMSLGGVRNLSVDASGSRAASGMVSAAYIALGVSEVARGPGAIQADGKFFSASEAQKAISLIDAPVTEKEVAEVRSAVYQAGFAPGATDRTAAGGFGIREMTMAYDALVGGDPTGGKHFPSMNHAASMFTGVMDKAISQIQDPALQTKLRDIRATPGGINHPLIRAFVGGVMGKDMEAIGNESALLGVAAATTNAVKRHRSDEASFIQEIFGGGSGLGAGALEAEYRALPDRISNVYTFGGGRSLNHGKGIALDSYVAKRTQERNTKLDLYYDRMTSSDQYQEAKIAASKGDIAGANSLMRAAMETTLSTDELRGLDVGGPIDVTRVYNKTGMAGHVAGYAAMVLGTLGGESVSRGVDNLVKNTLLAKTSLAKEWGAPANKEIDKLDPPKKKKRGPGTVSRTVGFGQQESAMASINKSLQSTERTLRALEKRLAEIPTPQSTGGAPAGTSVKAGP